MGVHNSRRHVQLAVDCNRVLLPMIHTCSSNNDTKQQRQQRSLRNYSWSSRARRSGGAAAAAVSTRFVPGTQHLGTSSAFSGEN
ncbi:unnamed protein product [Laminaria digitata]